MSEPHAITLTAGLHAPAQARAWLTELAATAEVVGGAPQRTLDDALLVTSELVTNAVRYGHPDVVLAVEVTPARMRISVSDTSDTMPVVASSTPAADRPSGRGLLIVAATAIDWGVRTVRGRSGKTVWADLALRAD